MALGADQIAAHTALDHQLVLWAYLPGEWQADQWPADARAEWAALRRRAAREVALAQRPATEHFLARNALLVRDSDAIIAVHDRRRGRSGTAYTVNLAAEAGRPTIRLDPHTRTVTMAAAGGR